MPWGRFVVFRDHLVAIGDQMKHIYSTHSRTQHHSAGSNSSWCLTPRASNWPLLHHSGFSTIFITLFGKAPVRISTSNVHHRALQTSIRWCSGDGLRVQLPLQQNNHCRPGHIARLPTNVMAKSDEFSSPCLSPFHISHTKHFSSLFSGPVCVCPRSSAGSHTMRKHGDQCRQPHKGNGGDGRGWWDGRGYLPETLCCEYSSEKENLILIMRFASASQLDLPFLRSCRT